MSHLSANMLSIGALSGIGSQSNTLSKTLVRLASAKRINSAADDAAGLSVANSVGTRADSLSQSMRNINDGIGLVHTAGAALSTISQNLTRMRELAVQASNGVLDDTVRGAIQTEFDALASEIDRVAQGVAFNGRGLLDGSTSSITVQAGEDSAPSSRIDIELEDSTSAAIGLAGAAVDTQANAQSAIDRVDAAIGQVNQRRSSLGASEAALDSAFRMADSRQRALSAAESRIRDADVAVEAAELVRNDLQLKSSIAVQAQANKLQAVTASLL